MQTLVSASHSDGAMPPIQSCTLRSSFVLFASGRRQSFAFSAGLHTAVCVCATYVTGTYMLRLIAAHKAVTQVGVVDCMLRKQVPTEVLLIA